MNTIKHFPFDIHYKYFYLYEQECGTDIILIYYVLPVNTYKLPSPMSHIKNIDCTIIPTTSFASLSL